LLVTHIVTTAIRQLLSVASHWCQATQNGTWIYWSVNDTSEPYVYGVEWLRAWG